MKYINSTSTNAFFNMALEEYVFNSLPKTEEYFILWQNENAIVIGKYQNALREINQKFVDENNISVVRRLSGGGAMYQDLGNLNFTFVVNQASTQNLDFEIFIKPVVHALKQIGVTAEFNSRNDIVIDGKKFSGNSQYNVKGRTMHHGTLLFNSKLETVGKALHVSQDKVEAKGIKSVRSRVTNIIDYLPKKITLEEFKQVLLDNMFEANTSLEEYALSQQDLEGIEKLKTEKYATWEWVYGKSPSFNQQKENRFPFGKVAISMQAQGSVLESISFSGDFFGNGEIQALETLLSNTVLSKEKLEEKLETIDIGFYVSGMDNKTLIDLILY